MLTVRVFDVNQCWLYLTVSLFVGVRLISNINKKEKRFSGGSVEVYKGGIWNKICDRNWTKAHADVVCKDIGFSEAIRNLSFTSDSNKDGNMSNLYYICEGTEEYLLKCGSQQELGKSSCPKVAGVVRKDEGNY